MLPGLRAVILRALLIALALSPGRARRTSGRRTRPAGHLEFVAIQAGAKFTGAFKRFHVALEFDPGATRRKAVST